MTNWAGGAPDALRLESEAKGQLQAIESVTDMALGHLDVDDLLDELLDRVASLKGWTLRRYYSSTSRPISSSPGRREVSKKRSVRGSASPSVMVFAGQIAAIQRPLALDWGDSTTVSNPLLWEKGIRAMLGGPSSQW
jgi:hypothetical protein